MPIADVVTISISLSGAGPTRAGFGEPLIASYHTHWTDRVREYSSPASMVADGFLVTDPAYLAASAVFAQTPAPPFVKIGRRALAYTQVLTVTCLSTSVTDTYSFQIAPSGGALSTVTLVSTGVPGTDAGTLATAITALAISGLTAAHTGSNAFFTLTMAAGKLLDIRPDSAHCTLADGTTDPGLATDLAAIFAADSNWYGLLLDSQSKAEIAAASTFAEANKRLFLFNNSDTDDTNSASTTNPFYLTKNAAYTHVAGIYAKTQLLSYTAAAWMGRLFPTDAGSENWAFKTLSGVPADNMSDTDIHTIENFNGSVYTALLGLNLTQFGKRGDGDWIDATRGTDALQSDIQVSVLSLQANSLKVPYSDAGVDMYRSVITGSLARFVAAGFLLSTPAPTVSLPLVATLNSTQRQSRNLPNVFFTAQRAGAINSVTIQGVLTA